MIRHLKYFSFILFSIIALFFASCSTEVYNPVGVWEEIGNPENKIILQKNKENEIASRKKGNFRWYVFNGGNTNFYIGDESNNLEILSADTMEIFSKEMRQFKKVYKKTDSKIEGFWLLNLLMPRETVAEIVGKPDSISKEHKMEEWFYEEKKVIRFNQIGVCNFSEKNMLNPDIQSVLIGDHYTQVIKKLGDPYLLQDIGKISEINVHYFFYKGENTKLVLKDSIVTDIIFDVIREQKEMGFLVDSEMRKIEFDPAEISNEGLFVNEKGKTIDEFTVFFKHNNEKGMLKLIGKNYHVIFRLYDDQTYQGAYSRIVKKSRNGEPFLDVGHFSFSDFVVQPDLLNENKLACRIFLKIKEYHAKSTVISGSFIIDIPDQTK